MSRWVSLFSRSGSEIGNIWKRTGKFPSTIYTNNPGDYAGVFNEMMSSEDIKLRVFESFTELFAELSNEDSCNMVTLHGFLKIIPDHLCSKFRMYNGHPGNIMRYSELKGINPQIKAFNLQHTEIGGVIHRVIPEIDSGEIICSKVTDYTTGLDSADDYFDKLSVIMLDIWIDFLKRNEDVE